MTEPQPPEDEPFRVWHRAASEQLLAAAQGQGDDPLAALWRAKDFADRALVKATPMEALVTNSLLEAIARVRSAYEQQARD